jgi:hypothetical protein
VARDAALDSGRGWVIVALGIVTILGLGFFYTGTGPARV